MKCKNLFFEKNKKNINLSSAEFAQSVFTVEEKNVPTENHEQQRPD